MISHETLAKATVAGSITVIALSLPLFADLGNDENFDQAPAPVQEVYEPPKISQMPPVESEQPAQAEPQRGKVLNEVWADVDTRVEAINPSMRTERDLRREAATLQALLKPPVDEESNSCEGKR